MSSRWFSFQALAPVAAFWCLAGGCGGIYDGRGEISTTMTIDGAVGGEIVIGQARVTFEPGALAGNPIVTLHRIPSIRHTGAYGPVYQLRILPISSLVRSASFELTVNSIGANHDRLVVGILDPALLLDAQQWVPIADPKPGSDRTSLVAQISPETYAEKTEWLLGAVVSCACVEGQSCEVVRCPAEQACNSNACQQCPNNVCPP